MRGRGFECRVGLRRLDMLLLTSKLSTSADFTAVFADVEIVSL